MLNEKELKTISTLLYKATKSQLLVIIQHIEMFPLKIQMNDKEYEDYYNENMKGKSFQKYLTKGRLKWN